MILFRKTPTFKEQAHILLFHEGQVKGKKINLGNSQVQKYIKELIQGGHFEGENGQLFPFSYNKRFFLLVGLGKEADLNLTALRIALKKALLSPFLRRSKSVEIVLHNQDAGSIHAAIEAVLIGTYSWGKYKTKDREEKNTIEKKIFIAAPHDKTSDEVILMCKGVNFTRDLINDNADVITSDYLEKVIRRLIKGKRNIRLEVLNRKGLEKKGLNLHLAVNKGSPKEPRLIVVRYTGDSKSKNYTAVIGKGITFDTGGLNLKPTGSIETMRTDMSGAAAVIGTLKNTIALNLRKNVIFAVAIAENAIGSGSFKPGDVIRSYSGKTVEIANTDAEGRLVLADALSYVNKNYKPSRIIDIATLTGACVVALGHDYAGLVTPDDNFSRELVRSSKETDDRIWRLPIYPELKDAVKSQMADIKNLGYPKGAAGTITAAEFLRQFTNGTPWAHLDIAGTAYVDNSARWYYGFGATGMGVRLLTHFLKNN